MFIKNHPFQRMEKDDLKTFKLPLCKTLIKYNNRFINKFKDLMDTIYESIPNRILNNVKQYGNIICGSGILTIIIVNKVESDTKYL